MYSDPTSTPTGQPCASGVFDTPCRSFWLGQQSAFTDACAQLRLDPRRMSAELLLVTRSQQRQRPGFFTREATSQRVRGQ